MDRNSLARWLQIVIIGVGLCLIIVYALLTPSVGYSLALSEDLPSFYRPWLFFLWGTAIPIGVALWHAWSIAREIGADNSFSRKNARSLRAISRLALVDTGYFFAGNIAFLFLSMSHPGVLLISLLICFLGVAVAVTFAALSHLIRNAAELKEESDLTI